MAWLLSIGLWRLALQGRVEEGIALAQRAVKAFQQFDVPAIPPRLAWRSAFGHARQALATRGPTAGAADVAVLNAAAQFLHDALGTTRTAVLERDGRQLSDDAAHVLLLGA